MGFIIKLGENEFVEWSSIADRPISFILNKEQIQKHIIEKRIKEVKEKVKKEFLEADNESIEYIKKNYLSCNCAGKNEEELTLKQIKEEYKQ